MDAIVASHEGDVQMIDTSIIRVHQQAATARKRARARMEDLINVWVARAAASPPRSTRSSKKGRPIELKLTARQDSDIGAGPEMVVDLPGGAVLLADKGYDADALRDMAVERGGFADIPPKSNRKQAICFSTYLDRVRNLVERFFNTIKHYRRVPSRHDKLAENFKATLQLAAARIWLRGHESTS